jgi:hypothetical protein
MAPPSAPVSVLPLAELSVNVLSVTVVLDLKPPLAMAPPEVLQELPEKVQSVTVRLANCSFSTAPPEPELIAGAVFADSAQLARARLPELSMAPPLPMPALPWLRQPHGQLL